MCKGSVPEVSFQLKSRSQTQDLPQHYVVKTLEMKLSTKLRSIEIMEVIVKEALFVLSFHQSIVHILALLYL